MNTKALILIITILFFCSKGFTQEIISSSGNHHKSKDLQIDWTMGEPIIESLGTGSIKLTQGFHQSSLAIIGITKFDSNHKIAAYPNPVKEELTLKTENPTSNVVEYHLFDAQGRHLQTGRVTKHEMKISFLKFKASGYLLNVTVNKKPVKTFKLIKKD